MDKENHIKTAWHRFMEVGELMPGVRPVIARSWFRCRKLGLAPYESLENITVQSNQGEKLLTYKKDLNMEIIDHVLQKLQDWLDIDEGLLIFATFEGTVLARRGGLSFLPPSLWLAGETLLEEKFGTIAPVLISGENPQVEVKGGEHYLALFHRCHSLAVAVELHGKNYMLGLLAPLGSLGKLGLGFLKAGGEILHLMLDKPQTITPLPLLERQEILKALKQYDSLAKAAEVLGISRSVLCRKMKNLGLVEGKAGN